MSSTATTAATLAGGYLLGRTKKAKWAVAIGVFVVARRLDLDPRRLGKLSAAAPETGSLSDQLLRELVEATKSAATHAITQRAAGLADSLHRLTQGRDASEAYADEDLRDGEYDGEYDGEPVGEIDGDPVDDVDGEFVGEEADEEEEPREDLLEEDADEADEPADDERDSEYAEEEPREPARRSRSRSTSGG